MKHTPEPWEAVMASKSPSPDYIRSAIDGHGLIAHIYAANEPHGKHNAARIVACVNACAGIKDPAELIQQRDELVTACKELLAVYHALSMSVSIEHMFEFCREGVPGVEDDFDGRAMAAIAKATGGAK